MNTVKLYKVTCTKGYMASLECGTGYSLTPWGENTVDYEGYDDGGKDYILPDGYSVGQDQFDVPHIYDENDNYCQFVSVNGNPAIVIDEPLPKILKRVK